MRSPLAATLLAAALLGASAPTAHAQAPAVQTLAPPVSQPQVSPPQVSQPWARPTAPRQQTGVAYMELRSAAGDRLSRVTTLAATRVEVHETRMDGDVMRMREVPALDLPPGRTVALAPGGHHLMLVGLKERLMPGQRFPLRLEFERAASVEVEVTVTATPPGAAGHTGQPTTGQHTGHDH